jgi:SAM-dependent methyltransferase
VSPRSRMGSRAEVRRSRRRRAEPWPTTLFVRHPGLFAPYLRAREALGRRELVGVRRILLGAGISPPSRVLDIACGLGRHIVPLGRAGYQVVGCDLSPAFLRETRARARRLGLRPPAARFYLADYARVARSLQRAGESPFDAVICLFTSMGYRGRHGDLRVLRSPRRIVRPGGLFIWETGDREWVLRNFESEGVNRPDAFHELREHRRYVPRHSDVHAVWTFYRRDGRGQARRIFETRVRVRLHTAEEMRELFQEAGWTVRGIYGDLPTLRRRSRTTRRLVAVAQRPMSGPSRRPRPSRRV